MTERTRATAAVSIKSLHLCAMVFAVLAVVLFIINTNPVVGAVFGCMGMTCSLICIVGATILDVLTGKATDV